MQPDVLKPTACMRRKPSKTYKSPTATEWTIYTPCPSLHPKSTSSTPTPPPSRVNGTTRPVKQLPSRSKQFTLQLLPLYHPHGQLACSLPPLDPLSFGLEAPMILNEPESSRSSSRARRRSPQVRAATDAGVQALLAPVSTSTVSAVAAVAAREIKEKEKPSPRKRRTGGGGSKRKRKDNDSSDATYPAKRTRAPRNSTVPQVVEEESPNEVEANGLEDQDELDAENETLVERRTTRSRAGLQRQSSVNTTMSDMPSKSVSPGAPEAPADPTVHHDIEMKTPESDHVETPTNQEPLPAPASMKAVQVEEKEEGELSDDGH